MAFKPSEPSTLAQTSPTPTPISSTSSSSTTSPTSSPASTSKATNAPIQTTQASSTPVPVSTPPQLTSAPSQSPSPSPTPTPGSTHSVDYTTMMTGSEIDYWNVSVSSGYTITLTDTMTVSNGSQYLLVSAFNGGSTVWSVTFLTSKTYQIGGNSTVFNCINGVVYVVVNSNSITFIGATSYKVPATFTSLTTIRTANGDGNFNSGNLKITLTQ